MVRLLPKVVVKVRQSLIGFLTGNKTAIYLDTTAIRHGVDAGAALNAACAQCRCPQNRILGSLQQLIGIALNDRQDLAHAINGVYAFFGAGTMTSSTSRIYVPAHYTLVGMDDRKPCWLRHNGPIRLQVVTN